MKKKVNLKKLKKHLLNHKKDLLNFNNQLSKFKGNIMNGNFPPVPPEVIEMLKKMGMNLSEIPGMPQNFSNTPDSAPSNQSLEQLKSKLNTIKDSLMQGIQNDVLAKINSALFVENYDYVTISNVDYEEHFIKNLASLNGRFEPETKADLLKKGLMGYLKGPDGEVAKPIYVSREVETSKVATTKLY